MAGKVDENKMTFQISLPQKFCENMHNMWAKARDSLKILPFSLNFLIFRDHSRKNGKRLVIFATMKMFGRFSLKLWKFETTNFFVKILYTKFRNLSIMKKGIFVSNLIKFFFVNNPSVLFEIGILSGSGPGFRTLPLKICLLIELREKNISWIAIFCVFVCKAIVPIWNT